MEPESAAGSAGNGEPHDQNVIMGPEVPILVMPPRPSGAPCASCGTDARDVATWQRRFPSLFFLALCDPCTKRFRAAANDRGRTAEDANRLAALYATLAGEVWCQGEDLYWFREGFLPRATAFG